MKKVIFAIFILAIFLVACNDQNIEIAQWGGLDRSSFYPDKDLLDKWEEGGPDLIWKYDSLGCGYASAAVLSDKVITIATTDSISYVVAFDHKGSVLYKERLGREWMANFPGNRSSPIICDGFGYFQGSLGVLYCFNVDNGKVVWSKDLFKDFDGVNNHYGITENFVINGEKIFVTPGGQKNNIIALNRFNGDLIWSISANKEESAYGSPNIIKIGNKKYLIAFTKGSLFSIDPESGEIFWSMALEGKSTKGITPVYKDGYLYAGAGYKNGYMKLKIADDGRSVETIWVNKDITNGMNGGFIYGDKLYTGTGGHPAKMFCSIDLDTGKIVDSLKMNPPMTTIGADGKAYVYLFRSGEIKLIDLENGLKIVGSLHIPGGIEKEHCSCPVIHDGRLYVRHDNNLFVYNIKE